MMQANLIEGLDLNRVIEALLNWPALLAVLLGSLVALYRQEFGRLLGRGDISISWGQGKSIQLRELSQHLDQDLQPVQDDLKRMQAELERITGKLLELETNAAESVSFSVGRDDAPARAASSFETSSPRPLRDVLSSRWRSLESIVADAGLAKPQALEELDRLEADGIAEATLDRAGRRIAKLRK